MKPHESAVFVQEGVAVGVKWTIRRIVVAIDFFFFSQSVTVFLP